MRKSSRALVTRGHGDAWGGLQAMWRSDKAPAHLVHDASHLCRRTTRTASHSETRGANLGPGANESNPTEMKIACCVGGP